MSTLEPLTSEFASLPLLLFLCPEIDPIDEVGLKLGHHPEKALLYTNTWQGITRTAAKGQRINSVNFRHRDSYSMPIRAKTASTT